MATASMSSFFRRFTRGLAAEKLRDQSDRQLVERLLTERDEAAFEAIMRRHGPMVYRVCWRALRQEQDTEDAFQATFLILAQQLHTVRKHASLASWLHGIGHRVALKARVQGTTRRHHEQKAATEKLTPDEVPWRELRDVLDTELQKLPENWRSPLILCYLEGRTQDEAAKQLGWSQRTLRRRLEAARAALGRRLTGRGVVWPVAMSAVLLSDCVVPAALAPGLVSSTVEAAACLATGQAGLTTAVSANAAALTEGVLKTMFLTKFKIAAGTGFLLMSLLVSGVAFGPAQGEMKAAPVGKKVQSDKENLQGSWVFESVELDCSGDDHKVVKLSKDQVKTQYLKWVFDGDKDVVAALGNDSGGTFKLDPTKKLKEIDFVHTSGPGVTDPPSVHRGIYKLEGDTLTLCSCLPEYPRPTRFAAGADKNGGNLFCVLKRQLPDKK